MAKREGYADALLRLVKALNETGIKYALTGAAAVGYYGIPRSSMDIDVVITGDLSKAQIEALTKALTQNGFTTSQNEIGRAFAGNDVKFQAFDDKTGFLRVDFFLEDSFDRVEDHINGLKIWFRTFEQLVVKKIQYGDLDEVKLLFERRGRRFRKGKIAPFLNIQQRAALERLLKETKTRK